VRVAVIIMIINIVIIIVSLQRKLDGRYGRDREEHGAKVSQ
jgi:hypothetical protein